MAKSKTKAVKRWRVEFTWGQIWTNVWGGGHDFGPGSETIFHDGRREYA